MDFLHIHSREDGGRLVLTHSYNLSHTCIGFGKLLTGFLWNLTFRNSLPMRAGTCELQPEIWRNFLFPKPMHHCCQLICHQSAMLYILIDVYLPNLATRTPYLELILTSELSYVYGCEASDPCTLGTPISTPSFFLAEIKCFCGYSSDSERHFQIIVRFMKHTKLHRCHF